VCSLRKTASQSPGRQLKQAAIVLPHPPPDGERRVEQNLQVAPVELLDRDNVFAGEISSDLGRRVDREKLLGLAQIRPDSGAVRHRTS